MLQTTVEIDDSFSPFIQMIIRNKPKWVADALKSAGWKSSTRMKKEIRSGAPGGRKYARLSLTGEKRRRLETVSGGRVKGKYTIMGDLSKAIGYEGRLAVTGVVPTGWLSSSAPYLGRKLQSGFETPVTPEIRRLYAAAGLKIGKKKKFLKTPARPTLDPMHSLIQRIAQEQFAAKIESYLNGNTTRSKARSKRIYKVYK